MLISLSVHGANNLKANCDVVLKLRENAGRVNSIYSPKASHDTVHVSTSGAFITALKGSHEGHVIMVEPGVYDIGWMKIKHSVNVKSRIQWGAELTGASIIELRGARSRIEGFRFTNGGPTSEKNSRDHSIYVKADDIEIINNQFFNVGVNSTVSDKGGITIEIIKSNRTRIAQNQFSNNHGLAIAMGDFSRDVIVTNNDFIDSPNYGGVGEIAHLGSAHSNEIGKSPHNDDVRAHVVNNYVRGWKLESELISIKSNKNVIAYNYIEDSGSGAFVVRMGNKNKIHNNYMSGNAVFPIRISGADNIFENNIFSGQGALMFLHNAVRYHTPKKNLNFAYLAANNNKINNNTFIGYEDVFGTLDQFYIVRDTPQNNEFIGNSVFTKNVGVFKKNMASTKHMLYQDNRIFANEKMACHAIKVK